MGQLDGRMAVITGVLGGLGRAYALRFAAVGRYGVRADAIAPGRCTGPVEATPAGRRPRPGCDRTWNPRSTVPPARHRRDRVGRPQPVFPIRVSPARRCGRAVASEDVVYLTQALHRALQQFPDGPMTVCGDRVRTTREVADRVARLAGAFRGLGLKAGDRVGILALNSDRHHEFFFASWWMGAVASPVNVRWSPGEIGYAMADSGTEVLLVDDTFVPLVPRLRELCPGLRTLVYCGDGPTPEGMVGYEDLVAAAEPVPDVRRGGDEVGLLLYTGGTTGLPKGVMITHRSLMTSLFGSILANRAVERGGVTLLTAPLFHIAAFLSWYSQALIGGTLVFLPVFSAEGFLDAVERHRVTTCILVPV
ncbi:AMP-binding protein, partial [Streptomyces sp. NPDC004609]|uniref:AMP-binding protein n=1 Tax=Streptomyces sp. NPDC004609 TaxID=3364704 RepID=UPI0036A743E8